MVRALAMVAVQRRVTVLMVSLAVVAFGYVGYSRLPLSLLPNISYPSITIQTDFPDAAPGEVENLVTKPVEEAVGVLAGLRQIHSVSRSGSSEVTLDFEWDADMDDLALEVREKLDRVFLPDEAEEPVVLRYDPSLDPVLRIALAVGEASAGDDLTLLRRVAEKKVKESIETVPGVASARVKGGLEEEIHIDIDQGKLAALDLSVEHLSDVVGRSNINRPGGALKSTESHYLVRTLNELDSIEEIAELVLTPGGLPVRVGDVATVSWASREREEIVRVDGAECVEIAIYKEGDANAVTVAASVRERLERLPRDLPAGMGLTILFDQSRFIERAIDEVRSALALGGLLAVVVVFLFLRDLRPTLIIATSIPLSVVACFVFMYRLDVSLNIMSLGGLTLGIGMLVDSSIVVLEAIDRRRRQGLDAAQAAVAGTTEVGAAVIASTLTTIAVFFPIVFVEGIAGELFRDQALTVTLSLMASLLVSLSLIPMLSSLERRRDKRPQASTAPVAETDLARGRLNRAYEATLRTALRGRWLVLAVSVAAFAIVMREVPKLGAELVPTLSEGEFHFEVTLPDGAPLARTSRAIAEMEQLAIEQDGVASVYATIGSRLVSGGQAVKSIGENLGQINVVMANRTEQVAEERVAETLRRAYGRMPGVAVEMGRPSFFSLATPVELLLFADDLDALRDYVNELAPKVAAVAGLEDVRSSVESGNPELDVVFDRDKLAQLDLTVRDASATLHDRMQGAVVTRYKLEDRLIDVRVRNRLADRGTMSDVENLVIAERNGVPVKLSAVATIAPVRGPAEIHRIQQGRVAIVSGELSGRSLGEVMADVEAVVRASPPPAGITYEAAGQSNEMRRSFASLQFAFGLAIFLVYLVMAGTFESLVHPLIILATIPFALIGVVLGLLWSGNTVNVISLIGTIFLAGVVVNNAIVLVDAINRGRRAGLDKFEAVVQAGGQRLRPILMTTLTTILALLPMAIGFGEGAELRAPMAIVIIFGLSLSTLLTLLVVPAAYMVVPSRVRTQAEDDELERSLASIDVAEAQT